MKKEEKKNYADLSLQELLIEKSNIEISRNKIMNKGLDKYIKNRITLMALESSCKGLPLRAIPYSLVTIVHLLLLTIAQEWDPNNKALTGIAATSGIVVAGVIADEVLRYVDARKRYYQNYKELLTEDFNKGKMYFYNDKAKNAIKDCNHKMKQLDLLIEEKAKNSDSPIETINEFAMSH